jgi:hypothetical protein
LEIHLHHHFTDPLPVSDRLLQQILAGNAAIAAALDQLSKDFNTMSGSISDQIDALTAKFQTDMDGITAQQADLHTQITTLTAELTPGATITQAQIDKLSAIEATAATLATPVVVTPPAA